MQENKNRIVGQSYFVYFALPNPRIKHDEYIKTFDPDKNRLYGILFPDIDDLVYKNR